MSNRMRSREFSFPVRLLLALVAVFLTVWGCSFREDQSTATKPTKPIRLDELPEDTHASIMAAKDDLFGRLSGRLMEVLQTEGPAAAIRVCSQEAPEIARQVSNEHNLQIGRTSLKLRNPNNVAPAWAAPAIQRQPNEPQFFDLGDSLIGALVPIKLQSTCILCHGPQDEILEEVKSELAEFYPQDAATGYQEGDLRGWFWIEHSSRVSAQPLVTPEGKPTKRLHTNGA